MSQIGAYILGSGGGGIPIETITPNGGGGPISPDGANNINFVGVGLTITGAGNTITFTDTDPGNFTWQVVAIDQTMVPNNGYIANKAGLLSLLLPAVSVVGDMIRVTGMNRNIGWAITQAAGQVIHFGATDTTVGIGGSLASTDTYDSIELVCNVANLEWIELSCQGNITII